MEQGDGKNLILAIALSMAVMLAWFTLFPPEEQAPATAEAVEEQIDEADLPSVDGATTVTPQEEMAETVEAARITIETPELDGSISLQGGRIDELYLKDYRDTVDPESDEVTLFRPQGTAAAYFAAFGWAAVDGIDADAVPGPDTTWTLEEGETLTPDSPVTLVWDNGAGQVFRTTISVDDKFMFDVSQSVENVTENAIELRPYGLIRRQGVPSDLKNFFILHEGLVRMSDGTLEEIDYDGVADYAVDDREQVPAERIEVQDQGWIGWTDHYWMTTLIPDQSAGFRSTAKYIPARDIYQAEAILPIASVAAGASTTVDTQLFAGAKEWDTIRDYQSEGITGFLDSIDWGWFFFLTKPMFWLLHNINVFVGNMGWSIILLTVCIKLLVLPLAYKSYVSMARMKEIQPEMEAMKERVGDDRQALQQGMMKLYKENKVNPAAGCLPILLQIPIFFSIYKVIFVTLELRHAPWIGWINDLSAPDPSSLFNLFGLLPYAAPEPGSIVALIGIGVLPIVLGVSMWLQQKLNPTPTDPTQKMIFAWMPWVFMFMLGSFASGLVLYWIANNTITFMQQYAIMWSHGSRPDLFGNIREGFKRTPKQAAANDSDAPKGKK
ncbi:MAG: membrane protein insertase YidC [Loktanella sp.]|nr:membrane protein insertase YidC [Loktanella sp.]